MAVEILQFLLGKFSEGLKEEDDTTIPFRSQFQEMKMELEKKMSSTMSPNTTDLLRESLYDLNDILEQCHLMLYRRRCRRRRRSDQKQGTCTICYSLRELWFLYKTRKRLLKIKQIIHWTTTGDNGAAANPMIPGNPSLHGETGGGGMVVEFDRWTCHSIDIAKIHGLSDHVVRMESSLIEREGSGGGLKTVGIVGMGGVGKTTLAQLLFNSQQVKRHFFPRLWVCASQTLEKGKDFRREIVERMLMSLGVEEEVISSISINGDRANQSFAELMFALHLQLLGKRYLIVLDDVWSADEWYEGLDLYGSPDDGGDEWAGRLACGLPKGNGAGIIVTSRIEEVAKKMVGEENTHYLSTIDDGEICWSIFMDALVKEGCVFDHPILRNMKTEIVDKCGGLPLAAKTIGEIMCDALSPSSSGTSSGEGNSSSDGISSGSLE